MDMKVKPADAPAHPQRLPVPQGYLDGIRHNLLQGWCFNPGTPGVRLKVEIFIDGRKYCEVAADKVRGDLKDAGVGDGAHGFSVDLTQFILDQDTHEIDVRILGGVPLSNSPQTLAPGAGITHRRPTPPAEVGLSFTSAPLAEEITRSELFRVIGQESDAGHPVFLCHPLVDWNLPLFQRPQHMAMAMAAEGVLTVYCSPRWRYESFEGSYKLRENLYVTSEFDSLVSRFKGLWIDYYSTCPTDAYTHAAAYEHRLVYEYVDHIDPEISGGGSAACTKYFNDLSRSRVGIFLATANVLHEELIDRFGPDDTILVPNGVNPGHYASAQRDPTRVPLRMQAAVESGKPVVGYFGALASWLDISTVKELAERRPDLEIVMIGPNYNLTEALPVVKNIHWLGAVDYIDLPQYATWFDCCIIPFRPGPIAQSTSPLKLFEYFALEKGVVVGSDMHECTQYDLVRSASTGEEYSTQIDLALSDTHDPKFKERSRELAVANSWRVRAAVLAQAMRDRHFQDEALRGGEQDLFKGEVRGFNLEAPHRVVGTYLDRARQEPYFGLSAGVFREGDAVEFSVRVTSTKRSRITGVLSLPANSPAVERDIARLQVWWNGKIVLEDRVGHHGAPFEFSFCAPEGTSALAVRMVSIKDLWEDWAWGKALPIGFRSLTVTAIQPEQYQGGWVSSPTAQMAGTFRNRHS